MIIKRNSMIRKIEHIDILQTKDGYRVHDYVSGMILKVNKITTFIIMVLEKECTFEELKANIIEKLGEDFINIKDLHELLINLYHLKVIDIINQKILGPKILLINPCYEYPNSAYRKIRVTPPLGILSIGTALHHGGYDVHLLDMMIEEMRPEDISSYIENLKPDFVGISMNFTSTANVCYEIAKKLKESSVKYVFVGGNHATFTYEEVLKDRNIDFVVRFHGEDTVPEFIYAVWNNELDRLFSCKGLVFRNNNSLVVTPRRDLPTDLNSLPIPKWDLLPIHKYAEEARWVLHTAQGCPCACTFCSTSSFNNGNKVITMNVEEIIKRIRHIIKLSFGQGVPIIGFCDDAFTHDRKRAIEFCQQIIDEKLKFTWSCNTRVDLVDEELIDLMYKAGCRAMLFGIESCSPRVSKAIGKKIDLEQAKEAITIAKKRGMKIREMFILGLPFEDNESLTLMEDFFVSTQPHEIRFGLLSVYPGTPLWNHSEKFGVNILTTDWGKYDLLRPTSNNTILSEDELYRKYIELTEKYDKEMFNSEIDIM